MSLFTNYRADRLIAEVKSSGNPGSPLAQKALEKLGSLGPSAIEPIIEALATSEKRETVAYVEVLSRLIDSKTLPQLLKVMAEANGRAMSGIAWALSSSKNYPAGALLDALTKPSMPKQALLDVIAAQKARYNVRELLNAAYSQEPSERAGLFKIIAEIADESSIDDLIARIEGKDPVARLHIINVLARFNNPKVQQAVQKQLKDNSKFIRSAALTALVTDGRSLRHGRALRHAARSGTRSAEQGGRCRRSCQSSRDHQVPGGRPQGRERIRAACRGRGSKCRRHL